jgi:CheY-like chemotaxis protein
MSRILLVHWNEKEAKDRARILKSAGHKARFLCDSEKPNLAAIRDSPPDLFLIDLARLPSHGREIAALFRRSKSTRNVPTLFVGGDADRVASARKLVPDATFGAWDKIEASIAKAIKNVPKSPVVPGTMAGYSGTPLPKKLGIRENHSVVLVNGPDRFERKLEPLPAGVEFAEDGKGANVALLFAKSEAELVRDFRPLVKGLPEKVALWIAWPKKSSGAVTDLTEDLVRGVGLDSGWVDYKVCAIDETWSGLCFARKK